MSIHGVAERQSLGGGGKILGGIQNLARVLWCENSGAAGVQYAVGGAVTIGVILFGIQALGLMSKSTFFATARSLSDNHMVDETDDGTVADSTEGLVPAMSHSIDGLASQVIAWGMVAGIPLVVFCWWMWHRSWNRKSPVPADDNAAEEDDSLEIDHSAVFKKRQEILRILSTDAGILFDSRLLVKHLMSHNVNTIAPSETADQVRQQMQSLKHRHLLVCDKEQRLVGVISDRDLLSSDAKTAKGLMTAHPVTVRPDDLISPAITLLINRRISCLPVVDGERLVGVLTITDLMMALQSALVVLQKVATEIAAAHADATQDADEPLATASA